nr:unnamed protein product [Callosobruchus analis]
MIENREVRVVESFIVFTETKNKSAERISEMILSKLDADEFDIMNCRGQAYENAATMAGKHTGMQDLKRILKTCWSVRGDAVKVIRNHYRHILTALDKLTETVESFNTRRVAGTLLVVMQSFSSYVCDNESCMKQMMPNDAEGLGIDQCAQKIKVLQIVLESKREKNVSGTLNYAKHLCEELDIPLQSPI